MTNTASRTPFPFALLRWPAALAMLGAAFLTAPLANAQEWMRQIGSELDDRAEAAMPDGFGGVIFTGETIGDMARINPGQHGSTDVILGRYDTNGNQLWLRQFGTDQSERGRDVTTDGTGGIFVTGSTHGAFGGPVVGSGDIFLAHFDLDGNELWVRQFGSSAAETGLSIAPDGKGGVYIGGETYGDIGGPHIGGSADGYLAHLDSNGDVLWIRQIGTAEYDQVLELAPDGAGGVFVAGGTDGVMAPSSGRQRDVFLARYDSQGTQLWVRQIGTQQFEFATALMADGSSGVVLAGTTDYHFVGQSAGAKDVFLTRYDNQGQQLWIKQFGGEFDDVIRSLVPDGTGGMMAGGYEGRSNEASATLGRYDADGVEIWSRKFGTPERDFVLDLAEAEPGMAFAAILTWGPLAGPHLGFEDIVIAKLGEELPPCYSDCDQSTGPRVLDIFDFLCFQNSFISGEGYACDCDVITGPGVCDIFDFLCFQNHFTFGCP